MAWRCVTCQTICLIASANYFAVAPPDAGANGCGVISVSLDDAGAAIVATGGGSGVAVISAVGTGAGVGVEIPGVGMTVVASGTGASAGGGVGAASGRAERRSSIDCGGAAAFVGGSLPGGPDVTPIVSIVVGLSSESDESVSLSSAGSEIFGGIALVIGPLLS